MQILTISNIPSGILDAIDELAADPMGGYPEAWTQFTVNITGVPSGTSGRLAFRYFVEDGGPEGTRSNYIGIDRVQYCGIPGVRGTPTPRPHPTPVPRP